jgi:hypothetical protein
MNTIRSFDTLLTPVIFAELKKKIVKNRAITFFRYSSSLISGIHAHYDGLLRVEVFSNKSQAVLKRPRTVSGWDDHFNQKPSRFSMLQSIFNEKRFESREPDAPFLQ